MKGYGCKVGPFCLPIVPYSGQQKNANGLYERRARMLGGKMADSVQHYTSPRRDLYWGEKKKSLPSFRVVDINETVITDAIFEFCQYYDRTPQINPFESHTLGLSHLLHFAWVIRHQYTCPLAFSGFNIIVLSHDIMSQIRQYNTTNHVLLTSMVNCCLSVIHT